jgi:prevent-host-death family protein
MLTRNRRSKRSTPPGTWKLQDAKAHFSEVVRKARAEGPQWVTVHGRDAVVIVAANEFAKKHAATRKALTGAAFVDAMQQARNLGLRLKPLRYHPTYRASVRFEDDK